MPNVDLKISNELLAKLADGPERGGLVLLDGTIVELTNTAADPNEGFQPASTELVAYIDNAAATWHTHPGETANLSVEDWETFILWPNLQHLIIGTDGVRQYGVKNGAVINA